MAIDKDIFIWVSILQGLILTEQRRDVADNGTNWLCCIVTIQLYKYTDAGKYETLTTLHCSGTKHLLPSWLSVFWHEERERETQFSLGNMTVPTSPSQHPSLTGPAQSQISTNCFFEITKFSAHRFRAWRHSHPSPISHLGFLWHLWFSYPLRASVNCTQCVCTCTKLNSSNPNQTEW